jgi:hypothetical protein
VELAGEPGELLALLALPGLGMLLRDAAHGREDVLEGVVESVGRGGAGVCCWLTLSAINLKIKAARMVSPD